jgi:phosphotransferase system  glucose/maltose/N-acetylglucosamine-specific IIC component
MGGLLLLILASGQPGGADPTAQSPNLQLSPTATIVLCLLIIVLGGAAIYYFFRYFCCRRFRRQEPERYYGDLLQ